VLQHPLDDTAVDFLNTLYCPTYMIASFKKFGFVVEGILRSQVVRD
jgi:sialic acid synthase SpsE